VGSGWVLVLACLTGGATIGFGIYMLAGLAAALHPRATWRETRTAALRAGVGAAITMFYLLATLILLGTLTL
jgi:hypothetical protein